MQIIKFKWNSNVPTLILENDEKIKLKNEISFVLGEKHCIGYISNGIRYKCLNKTSNFNPLCKSCEQKDMYYLCRKCDGTKCLNPKMRERCKENLYHLYIAMIGTIPKVGISASFRLKERLIEQGADFGAHIMSIVDGKEARIVEQKLSKYLGITDRINSQTKMKMLKSDVGKCVATLNKIISKLKFCGLVKDFEVYDFRKYYNIENVPEQPKKLVIRPKTKIEGKVVAVKGNIVVIESEKEFKCFDAQHLVGYEIE